MKNKIILLLFILLAGSSTYSQDLSKFHLYKPGENAEKAIAAAVKEAKQNGKHVLVQVGGNWCIWCARFNEFVTKDTDIAPYIDKNYVVYHLNYSQENYNHDLLTKYGFPQRFGFPVFLILNGDGQLIHTENSSYLEEGMSYGKIKIIQFLKNWNKAAFDPAQYKEQ